MSHSRTAFIASLRRATFSANNCLQIERRHIESSIRSRQNEYILNFLGKKNVFSYSFESILCSYREQRIIEWRQAGSVQVRRTLPIERLRSMKKSKSKENDSIEKCLIYQHRSFSERHLQLYKHCLIIENID